MKITSQQKKFILPLAGFIASCIAWYLTLGTLWAILCVAPMVACFMVFAIYNGDRIVKLAKAEHEAQEDWERFLDEVAENDNVTIAPREDGSVRLSWVVPKED